MHSVFYNLLTTKIFSFIFLVNWRYSLGFNANSSNWIIATDTPLVGHDDSIIRGSRNLLVRRKMKTQMINVFFFSKMVWRKKNGVICSKWGSNYKITWHSFLVSFLFDFRFTTMNITYSIVWIRLGWFGLTGFTSSQPPLSYLMSKSVSFLYYI